MNIIKKILFITFLLMIVNLLTFYTVGVYTLSGKIVKIHSIKKPPDNLNIIFIHKENIRIKNKLILNYFKSQGFNTPFIQNIKELSFDQNKRGNFYFITIKKKMPFYYIVDENIFYNESYPAFIQVWESKYIWFFYKWVLVKKKQTVIS